MRQVEDDYAKKLDEINERVQQRSLLLEDDPRKKAIRQLERKIKYAMQIAHVTEEDLVKQQSKSSHVAFTTTRLVDSS